MFEKASIRDNAGESLDISSKSEICNPVKIGEKLVRISVKFTN